MAVVVLDSIASHKSPRLEIAGQGPRSPAPGLVATAAARLAEETGRRPETASTVAQLIDLALPLQPHGAGRVPRRAHPGDHDHDRGQPRGHRHASGPPRPGRPRPCRPSRGRPARVARRQPRARARYRRLYLRRWPRRPGLGHRAALHRVARSVPALPRRSRGAAAALARAAGTQRPQLSPASRLLALRRDRVCALRDGRCVAERRRGGDQSCLGGRQPLAAARARALLACRPSRLAHRADPARTGSDRSRKRTKSPA